MNIAGLLRPGGLTIVIRYACEVIWASWCFLKIYVFEYLGKFLAATNSKYVPSVLITLPICVEYLNTHPQYLEI